MMAAVPKASVIITNPTHYSVALSYERGMQAPICVAKGVDLIALKIREIAGQHDIPIVENVPLARALLCTVEIDEEIPVGALSRGRRDRRLCDGSQAGSVRPAHLMRLVSDSNICIPLRQAPLQMLESKDHWCPEIRNSHTLAAPLLRTSDSKGHQNL